MVRLALWFVLAASALLLFVSVWILVPAPNRFLLPLAVGAPELSPALLIAGVLVSALSAAYARRRDTARLALVLAATSVVLSLLPVAQLPFALQRFNQATMRIDTDPPGVQSGDIRVTRNVSFAKSGGAPLSLDVYQPPAGSGFPILMQIYGGSWQSGTPSSEEWFSRYFAQRGYLVVAIDYRHAPEWKWPEQIVDVRRALRLDLGNVVGLRRRSAPHRRRRTLGWRAAGNATGVSGASLLDPRRRQLLRPGGSR